jgi:hypothetical protein
VFLHPLHDLRFCMSEDSCVFTMRHQVLHAGVEDDSGAWLDGAVQLAGCGWRPGEAPAPKDDGALGGGEYSVESS